MKGYADLHGMSENERIKFIGESVMLAPSSSADKPIMNCFIVEDNKKAKRYTKKLLERFPTIRIIDQTEGPINGVNMVTVRIGPPLR